MKDSLKQLVSPISIFETLGLKYGGPIDGHDIRALEKAMRDASAFHGPVVIHVVTDKGHGYAPAVGDEVDKFHGVSSFDASSGTLLEQAGGLDRRVRRGAARGCRGGRPHRRHHGGDGVVDGPARRSPSASRSASSTSASPSSTR